MQPFKNYDNLTYQIRGETNMASILREGGEGKAKMSCYRALGEGGVLELHHDQWPDTIIVYTYIIDKKSSFSLWRQTVKSSFNDAIALFVGWIKH